MVALENKGNTHVSPIHGGYAVYLHDNCIARVFYNGGTVHLSTCGWCTNTTKQRMNMVLAKEGFPCRVHSVKGEWWCGDTPFTMGTLNGYYGVVSNELYCTVHKETV